MCKDVQIILGLLFHFRLQTRGPATSEGPGSIRFNESMSLRASFVSPSNALDQSTGPVCVAGNVPQTVVVKMHEEIMIHADASTPSENLHQGVANEFFLDLEG